MRMFKLSNLAIPILSLALLSVASSAHADSWKDATKAFAQKRYAAAMKMFRPLAEKGHAAAQYQVALMHKMGLGVSKSEKEARKWSRLAARQGNTDAQLLLGSLYYKQEGSESPDVVKAYIWYEVAAAQGNAEAQKEVATITKELTPQQLADAQAKAQQCKSSNYEKCDGD
jgi:TPR repeat protein